MKMKIQLSKIKPNPHRNLERNPVSEEQVDLIVESIKRNNWGENVIVRKHPTEEGFFQLAYGHNRYAALQKLKYKEAVFIVQPITEWGMYTWMVDENDSQRNMTPELIMENVEAGIKFLEPVIRECETFADFELRVSCDTPNLGRYQEIRVNLLNGEGLGAVTLSKILPGRANSQQNIQSVVEAHYGKQKQQVKIDKADAKRKEAVEKRIQADEIEKEIAKPVKPVSVKKTAKSAAPTASQITKQQKLELKATEKRTAEKIEAKRFAAKKLRDDAQEADRQAEAFNEEADKLASSADKDALLLFDNAFQMRTFAQGVKRNKIPRTLHQNLAQYLLDTDISAKKYKGQIDAWWFTTSGKAAKLQSKVKKANWAKKHRSVSINEFSANLVVKAQKITKEILSVKEFADQVTNSHTRAALEKSMLDLELAANSLGAICNDTKKDFSPSMLKIAN